ncbi:hypothetical protein Tco_0696193 [Tanacetum coccineum]
MHDCNSKCPYRVLQRGLRVLFFSDSQLMIPERRSLLEMQTRNLVIDQNKSSILEEVLPMGLSGLEDLTTGDAPRDLSECDNSTFVLEVKPTDHLEILRGNSRTMRMYIKLFLHQPDTCK